MSRFFGPLRQMGFVVRDIDKAMRHWVEVCGIGPWYIAENCRCMASGTRSNVTTTCI
jgi:hypothetical protein